MKPIIFFILLAPGLVHANREQNWMNIIAEDPVTGTITCLIQTPEQLVYDGQSETPVRIIYNGQQFIVTTRSNIDMTYPGIGLVIDRNPANRIDRIFRKTDIIFEQNAKRLQQQFIHGRTAIVTLGFWPTWPKSNTVSAKFSLIGFTRSYRNLLDCTKNRKAN